MLNSFLNKFIILDGFELVTSDEKNYTIGKPIKNPPIILRLKNKSIEYKLLSFPDFYLGKGYTDGDIEIENGTISEILNIALKNIGSKDISQFSKFINNLKKEKDDLHRRLQHCEGYMLHLKDMVKKNTFLK